MRTYATKVLMDHTCRQSPHARRRREIWSITGRLSTKRWSGHFSMPSHLRCRSPDRSTMDPPVFRKYRLSHCLASIATNAARSDINKLVYMRLAAVTISLGGSSCAGGTMTVSAGRADRLRVRRIARRSAADCSFGSGSSFDWTSMTNAELTAENRPACGLDVLDKGSGRAGDKLRTKMRVVLRSSSYFLT